LVEFAILGPLEARRDKEPVQLGGPKQRALLAMLLLEAGRAVSTDRLLEALWEDDPPATATASLQNFVAQLRKTLGPDVIETRQPGYLVRLEPEQLDVARVRSLVDAARASEPVRRAALLDDALALWRGEPLAEFRYESFAREEIARLEEFHLTLVEERAEAKLAIGEHAEVVSELEGLVHAHPLRERLRAQLMLALYRSGRQAEALESYREGRELLVGELGLEPSPLLRGVHASILRQETFAVDRGAVPEVEHFEEVAAALLAGKVTVVVGSDSEPGSTRTPASSRASRRRSQSSTARARCTTRSTRSSRETASRRPSTVSSPGCRRACASARARSRSSSRPGTSSRSSGRSRSGRSRTTRSATSPPARCAAASATFSLAATRA
jgi:DNA-binding SARP family transcriptional activator